MVSICSILGVGLCSEVLAITREELKQETEQIFKIVEANYGPLKFKQDRNLFKWEELKSQYLQNINTLSNSRDYHFLMSQFFSEFQDAHVSVTLPSTLKSELPIQFSFVEGKTIVTWVSESALTTCHAQIGDELLSIDGKNPEEIRKELGKFLTVGNVRSNQSYLTMVMTSRNEARGLPVSYMNLKESEIRMVDRRTGLPFLCVLPWKSSGVALIGRDLVPENIQEVPAQPSTVASSKGLLKEMGLSNESVTARVQEIFEKHHKLFMTEVALDGGVPLVESAKKDRGQKRILGRKELAFVLPAGAKPVELPGAMKALSLVVGSGLSAYVVPVNGKKVGVLRIPAYMATLVQFVPLELRYYMGYLEKNVDQLVIDQTHNPGGAVVYSDWVIESLTGKIDQNLHMKFLVRPRHSFMRQYAELRALLEDETLVRAEIRKKYEGRFLSNYQKLLKAYEKNDFLSEPIDLTVLSEFLGDLLDDTLFGRVRELPMGAEVLNWITTRGFGGIDITRKQYFTKPVTMMVDELDFSGGDATPASLQDYGRVKLVGLNTAGAGGTVEQFQNFLTDSFGFNLTTSLMYRKGGIFVENDGVQPESLLEPTLGDYLDGFKNYFAKVLEKAEGL